MGSFLHALSTPKSTRAPTSSRIDFCHLRPYGEASASATVRGISIGTGASSMDWGAMSADCPWSDCPWSAVEFAIALYATGEPKNLVWWRSAAGRSWRSGRSDMPCSEGWDADGSKLSSSSSSPRPMVSGKARMGVVVMAEEGARGRMSLRLTGRALIAWLGVSQLRPVRSIGESSSSMATPEAEVNVAYQSVELLGDGGSVPRAASI